MSLVEIQAALDRIARETWHASEINDSDRETLEQVALYVETARGLVSVLTHAEPTRDTSRPQAN
jgi:hypothetical protein